MTRVTRFGSGRAWARGAERPPLVLKWHVAPDGRGLVAEWLEAPTPWFAPVGLHARPSPCAQPRRRVAVLKRAA
ncbi:hypothetical protein [Thermaurantiacus sp.]